MMNRTLEAQAKEYVYDLKNCANEYGFKADEGWELRLTSDVGRIEIEKKYYPTIYVKVFPEILSELFVLVKGKILTQADSQTDTDKNITSGNLQYLMAFNPKRTR